MTFEVRIGGAAAEEAATHADHAAASSDNNATLDPEATPPATWKPYDPALAPARPSAASTS